MANNVPRHKVFISFHEEDIKYKERLVKVMASRVVDMSVDTGSIVDSGLPRDEIRRRIRDDYIADATVTVVLVGSCTWQRMHVDSEISASLIDRPNNQRCGLLGIRLPTHADFSDPDPNLQLLPPRLADNCQGLNPYAEVHRWSGSPNEVTRDRGWIHRAFERKNGARPNNSRRQFNRNRRGNCGDGWRD